MKKNIDGIPLEMDYVDSTMLSTVGYVEEERMLAIEFSRGPVYVYNNVPKNVFDELLKAPSIDDYFTENIKNGYKNKRVW